MAEIGVGMVGYQFMGRSHSNAFRQVTPFMSPKLTPRMVAVCGRNEDAVKKFAEQFGWEEYETDYKKLIARDDIQVIDIGSPGDTHAPIAIAAAKAGKHILCEKPLANTLAEAKEMYQAVKGKKIHTMVAFNYRRVPAVALAKKMIKEGRLGRIYHFRGVYLQSWLCDPKLPRFWRMDKTKAGSGALGDLGAHVIDLARHLVGEIKEVVAETETFVKQRPMPDDPKTMGKVTVDDMAAAVFRFENGARGTMEVTRFATGRENAHRFEINGEKGGLWFDLEDMNRLHYYDNTVEPATARGWSDILVSRGDHPYWKHWWPGGHIIGWEHTFTHEVYDFLQGIATGKPAGPDFRDGAQTQAVLEAVGQSAKSRGWERVEKIR
jgi:predicted dehydrogenase